MRALLRNVVRFAFVASLVSGPLAAQDDVAGVSSEDLRAGKDETKRYFLIEPLSGTTAPKQGFGLVVVLPGGDGSAEFHPFVKRIYKNAVPEGYLLAQPVAVKWTEAQTIVWPTARNSVEGMKFSTFTVRLRRCCGSGSATTSRWLCGWSPGRSGRSTRTN